MESMGRTLVLDFQLCPMPPLSGAIFVEPYLLVHLFASLDAVCCEEHQVQLGIPLAIDGVIQQPQAHPLQVVEVSDSLPERMEDVHPLVDDGATEDDIIGSGLWGATAGVYGATAGVFRLAGRRGRRPGGVRVVTQPTRRAFRAARSSGPWGATACRP